MHVYLIDAQGVFHGPVDLPVVPGLGEQLPSNAVELPELLPSLAAHHVWAIVDGEVQQLPDYRGSVYSIKTGDALEHLELGPLPDDVTTEPRPSPAYHWVGDTWVKNPEYVHAEKVLEINRACESAITGGFWSAALGAAYLYNSQIDDQLNLTGVILAGIDSDYPCRDGQGIRAFRAHTAQQLRQVGDDFTAYKQQLRKRADALRTVLGEALDQGDVAALEAVVWDDAQ